MVVVCAWDVKQVNGRWRRLRWKMDEAFAANYAEKKGVDDRNASDQRASRFSVSPRMACSIHWRCAP